MRRCSIPGRADEVTARSIVGVGAAGFSRSWDIERHEIPQTPNRVVGDHGNRHRSGNPCLQHAPLSASGPNWDFAIVGRATANSITTSWTGIQFRIIRTATELRCYIWSAAGREETMMMDMKSHSNI
jgi:hypothetical protein